MNTFKTADGTTIFYKDWGAGPVVTFSHGWPLCADAWDSQMLFLGQRGFRVIAHDRRGHGRSGQTWTGNTMDQYADDLAELIHRLDLRDITMVGHSTGGGEVARYIGRHGNARVTKTVLISSVPPIMLKTDSNPGGLPISVFDDIQAGVAGDRSQYYRDLSLPFYGYNAPELRFPKAFANRSGCKEWNLRSSALTIASRPSPRPTRRRISRRLRCPL